MNANKTQNQVYFKQTKNTSYEFSYRKNDQPWKTTVFMTEIKRLLKQLYIRGNYDLTIKNKPLKECFKFSTYGNMAMYYGSSSEDLCNKFRSLLADPHTEAIIDFHYETPKDEFDVQITIKDDLRFLMSVSEPILEKYIGFCSTKYVEDLLKILSRSLCLFADVLEYIPAYASPNNKNEFKFKI